MKHLLNTGGLLAIALMVFSNHAVAQGHKSDIVDTAVAAGSFNTLAAALDAADLIDALKGDGPFTVFAPTDEAFAKLPAGTVETLLKPENKDQLISILTYHVVPGKVKAKKVVKLSAAETLNGQRVDIKVEDGSVMIDGATVTATDIMASNGIIHVIDNVILPNADVIPVVAEKAGVFNTLLAAVKAAGLADVLSSEGPFTVFAPTDEAFAKLPEGTVASLLEPENLDQLQTILKYHVVSGRVYSDAVVKKNKVETLAGEKIRVTTTDGVKINDANVVATDIDAANGVVHIIDSVLLPPAEMSENASATGLIEMAIRKGVPLFNHGQPAATAAIYEVAARAILAMEDVPGDARTALRRGIVEMSESHSARDQAWAMRYALDDAYAAMNGALASNSH